MQVQTNAKGYVKDIVTGVVLNNEAQENATYIQQREHNKKMQNCQNEIELLKKELHEIRMLLQQHLLDEK